MTRASRAAMTRAHDSLGTSVAEPALGANLRRPRCDGRRARKRGARAWEDLIADAGLCGAMVRSPDEWDTDITAEQLATRPVVDLVQVGDSPPEPFPDDLRRSLDGIRVLDLTHVLAGPTCARTLAAFGANVLRIGSEDLPVVPLFTIDSGLGKRSARLDLKSDGRRKLQRLLKLTDVFSQGSRTGAMERLGLGVTDVVRARPDAVCVSINCYGHETEWRQRPGWEQLAQTVTGMANVQAEHTGSDRPTGTACCGRQRIHHRVPRRTRCSGRPQAPRRARGQLLGVRLAGSYRGVDS